MRAVVGGVDATDQRAHARVHGLELVLGHEPERHAALVRRDHAEVAGAPQHAHRVGGPAQQLDLLGGADVLTRRWLLPEAGLPDDVYEAAREHFDEEELAQLIFACVVINAWNRIAVPTHMVPEE